MLPASLSPRLRSAPHLLIAACAAAIFLSPLSAQSVTTTAGGLLPDAPVPVAVSSSSSTVSSDADLPFGLGKADAERASHMAATTDKYVLPGQLAPKLTPGNKVELGLIQGISAYGVLSWFVSAGESHLQNSSPNYGTDRGALGERLGAAALRGYTNEVLRDSLMANVFHQDPRFYKMGPRRNVVVRTFYAGSRTLVTRNDDGRPAPNYSFLGGSLIGSALTNAFYPPANRGLGQTAQTFGNAVAGSSLSFVAREFLSGAFEAAHLFHVPR